jgi:hypothetical protein
VGHELVLSGSWADSPGQMSSSDPDGKRRPAVGSRPSDRQQVGVGHPVAGVRHRANMAWELGWTQQRPYPSQQHNRRQRRHRPQHGLATSQQDRQHSHRDHMSGDHAEAGRHHMPAMAMPGEAEQDVKPRLRGEQQGGDSADGQPPVREGHARGGQQSRTEEKRSGGWEASAGNDVPGCGHKQAGSRQREAAQDSSPSARQRLHGHSLDAELSRRKGPHMPDSLRRTSRMLGWRCYRAEGGQLGRRASLIGDRSGSDAT